MIFMVDTANIEEIKLAFEYFPVVGVTTNPTIVAKENRPFYEIIKDIRAIIGDDAMLHVQAVSLKAEDILEEAKHLMKTIGGNLYIKVPAIPEGYKAMKLLKAHNIPITATAICSAPQALVAAAAGADFVAPYVNRADDVNSSGIEMVEDIARLLDIYGYKTQILAASFKNVRQIHEVSLAGAGSITIGYDLLGKMVANSLSDWSVNKFVEDWEGVYGENVTTINVK